MTDLRTIIAIGGYNPAHLDPRDAAFERWLVARAAEARVARRASAAPVVAADERHHAITEVLLRDARVAAGAPERPRIGWIGTAGGDGERYVRGFEEHLAAAGAEPTVLRLFHRDVVDLEAWALGCDAIVVGGGNTVSLLAVWRAHGLPPALRTAWEAGVVLSGVSAGMLCWFEGGTTDSFDLNRLAPLRDGLGLLAGSACPHYDGEVQRRPLYESLVAAGELPPGLAVDDGAAVVFTGTTLSEVIAWRGQTAAAYEVSSAGSSPPLPTTRI